MRLQAIAFLSAVLVAGPAVAQADDEAPRFADEPRLASGHLLEFGLQAGSVVVRGDYARSEAVHGGSSFTAGAQLRGRLASIVALALSGDVLPSPGDGAPGDPAAPGAVRDLRLTFANLSVAAGVFTPPLWFRVGSGVGITAGVSGGTELARMSSGASPRGGSFLEPEVQILARVGPPVVSGEERPLYVALGGSWRRYARDSDLLSRWLVTLAVGFDFRSSR
jgi:hypothetical protein